jgi:hypothetical protein
MRKSKNRQTSRQLRGCESCRGMDGIESRGLATCATRGVAWQADMYRFEMDRVQYVKIKEEDGGAEGGGGFLELRAK